MSEKIFAWLLRLYPSQFRETYGEDSLQLFRDRARDEKGFFPTLRLWFDLLTDLAISIPREYLYLQRDLVVAPSLRRLDGAPSFFILEDRSLRPESLLFGCLATIAVIGTLSISLGHVAHRGATNTMMLRQLSGQSESPQPQFRQLLPQEADDGMNRAVAALSTLDAGERRRVINAAISNLKLHYVDRDAAQKMADALLAHEQRGEDDGAVDGRTFANLLTWQMREVSSDMHLDVIYSREPLPDHPLQETPESMARYRRAMERQNCTFEKAQILPRNIGYLKLNSFPDPAVCQSTAEAAMASLNNADALIFDLRDNHGGQPDMVSFIAAYLFDHPEYWYNPRENTTQRSWTRSPVPGNKLADKPVYILTSHTTFSGAEQFCYDLKMLKRATLVGETTGGAAHAGAFHRIDEHFGMGIPEAKPINPYSKFDWEETGVAPDVPVKAADALKTALKLAASKQKK